MGKFLNWSKLITNVSVEVIDLIDGEIALSKSFPMPSLVSLILTNPSIFASNWSNWAWVRDRVLSSEILNVKAAGRLLIVSP